MGGLVEAVFVEAEMLLTASEQLFFALRSNICF
jgi:hypothetical protein